MAYTDSLFTCAKVRSCFDGAQHERGSLSRLSFPVRPELVEG